jgi:ubiquinone/menaquinone biosynthesis C-methylase UbiE
MKTLIIGSGIRQVKKFNYPITAIDISQEYLDKAKEFRPRNKYIKANVEKMPFKNNTFNKVYFTHVLEHVDNPIKAIDEIYRILEDGGILYCNIPSKEMEVFLCKHNDVFCRDVCNDFHKTQWNKEDLSRILRKFSMVKIKENKGKNIMFWYLWGRYIKIFSSKEKFYIEECGQIHCVKYDKLTRQLSRCFWIIDKIINFKNITYEYKSVAIK